MSLPWYGDDTQQQPSQYGHVHGRPTDHDVQWPSVVHEADWSEWTRHLDHTDLHTPQAPLSADLNSTASSVLDNLHRPSGQQPPPHPPPPPAAENPLDSAFQRSPPQYPLDHSREPSPPLSYGVHHTINAGNAFPALNFTSTSSNPAASTSSSSRDPIFQALAGRSLSNVTGVQQVSAGPSSSSGTTQQQQQQTSQQATASQGSSQAVTGEESHGSIPPQHEDWLNQLPPINPEPDQNQANRWADTVLNRSPLPHPEGAEDGFPGIDIDLLLSEDEAEMAARRHRAGPGEGAIDLTGEGSSPVVARAPRREPRSLRRVAAEEVDEEDIGVGQAPEGSGGAQQRPRKRRKRTTQASRTNDDNISANDSTNEEDSNATPRQVEHLDLTTDEAAVEASIAEQQSQHSSSANNLLPPTTGTRLNQKTCIICMESFTNATATPCGHMFCYECLHQALLAGEKNSERGVGTCPVCRKPIHRNRGHRGNKNLLPIAFMKRSAFYTKGRGKEVDERRKAAEG